MKKVFIDAGAYDGDSYKKFLDNKIITPEFECHLFEPNPIVQTMLKTTGAIIHEAVIWTKDGTVKYYKDTTEYPIGGTLIKEKISGVVDYFHPLEVKSINFSKWITDNFSKDDYIVLKMDIEGAEYSVLEKMVEDDSLDYIDMIYIEWHEHKISDIDSGGHRRYWIQREFKKRNIIEKSW